MTVTSSDFLVSAQTQSQAADEMSHRNCVSRAYYSVYHAAYPVAEAHLDDPNKNFSMGAHQRLSERYLASKVAGARSIGYVLASMKSARHRADYDLADNIVVDDAVQALATARKFAQYLAAFEQAVTTGSSGSQQGSQGSPQQGTAP